MCETNHSSRRGQEIKLFSQSRISRKRVPCKRTVCSSNFSGLSLIFDYKHLLMICLESRTQEIVCAPWQEMRYRLVGVACIVNYAGGAVQGANVNVLSSLDSGNNGENNPGFSTASFASSDLTATRNAGNNEVESPLWRTQLRTLLPQTHSAVNSSTDYQWLIICAQVSSLGDTNKDRTTGIRNTVLSVVLQSLLPTLCENDILCYYISNLNNHKLNIKSNVNTSLSAHGL